MRRHCCGMIAKHAPPLLRDDCQACAATAAGPTPSSAAASDGGGAAATWQGQLGSRLRNLARLGAAESDKDKGEGDVLSYLADR
jgi:hypothetical protein